MMNTFISGERQYDFVSKFNYVREAGTCGEQRAAETILQELKKENSDAQIRTEEFSFFAPQIKRSFFEVTAPYHKVYEACTFGFCSNTDEKSVEDIPDEDVPDKKPEVEDSESDELLEQLQKLLKENVSLKNDVKKLQAEKAVSGTKVSKLEEQLNSFKTIAARAGKKAIEVKSQGEKVDSLIDENKSLKEQLVDTKKKIALQESKIDTLIKSRNDLTTKSLADYKQVSALKESLDKAQKDSDKKLTEANDKIVKANSGDDILGICSGTAMVLGDSAEWNWSKRYLTDDFGRIIYEDRMEHHEAIYNDDGELIKEAWDEEVHAPKQNPDYDSSKAYTKRADRPEWQIVGMMGKLYVRDDGSCVVNGYADVVNGIATKATGKTNMRVMERINDSIVRVLLK